MDVGVRKHETATLNVVVPMAVPEHMREGMRELLSVFTPESDRRKGYATALLAKVCEEADEHRKVLMLTTNVSQLVPFYRRFGFVELPRTPNGPAIMARQFRVSAVAITEAVRRRAGRFQLSRAINQALH